MILEFIIALAIWDFVKFLFSIVIIATHREESQEEAEVQNEVSRFEKKLREKMNDERK